MFTIVLTLDILHFFLPLFYAYLIFVYSYTSGSNHPFFLLLLLLLYVYGNKR